MTSAWPKEYSTNAEYIGWRIRRVHALRDESMLLTHLQGDRPVRAKISVRPVEEPKADYEAHHPGDEWAESQRVLGEREHR